MSSAELNAQSDTRVRKFSDIVPDFGTYGISSHEQVGEAAGARIAGGIAIFKDVSHPWTLWYDEVLFCHSVEGRFEMEIGGIVQEMKPGDVISIPAGTHAIYRATGRATLFYAVTPVDWASQLPAALAGDASAPSDPADARA